MNKELTVSIQEPLSPPQISIDIATLGWQTIRYRIYDKGTAHPDIIPTTPNLYFVRISYQDSLTSSQVYIHSNQSVKSDFSFNILKRDNTILCELSSYAYPELNKTVELKNIDVDTAELLQQIEKKMGE